MKPAEFEYRKPASLREALDMLTGSEGEIKVLAGGQSLVPMMNFRVARPERLIDINAIVGLDYIKLEGDQLVIGALARHAQIKASPIAQAACPLMCEAYNWVAHHPIRTRGTLCGNLCHSDPASEMPAVMVTVGAEMVLRSARAARTVAAADFFVGIYETIIRPDEVLVEVRIPVTSPGQYFGFVETSMRRGDFALCCAMAIVTVKADKVESAAVTVAGIYDRSMRLGPVEAMLHGAAPDAADLDAIGRAAIGAYPVYGDQRISEEYKRDLLEAHVRRAVDQALNKSLSGGAA